MPTQECRVSAVRGGWQVPDSSSAQRDPPQSISRLDFIAFMLKISDSLRMGAQSRLSSHT